jgi:hypothetical protein
VTGGEVLVETEIEFCLLRPLMVRRGSEIVLVPLANQRAALAGTAAERQARSLGG